MSLRLLCSLISLVFLQTHSPAEDIQSRAQALIQHARQLSDIRSANSPAFQLKATFSFVSDSLETVEGTYTETWMSQSEWRHETVIRDLHFIDIGGSGKHWLVYPEGFPERAQNLPVLMAFVPPVALQLKFDSIQERATADATADCAFTKPVIEGHPFVFCFEKKTGVLLEKVYPEKRPRNVVGFSCEYARFRKFGDYAFPREMACFEDLHKTITANVVELTVEPSVDPALFNPPVGAVELATCSGKVIPPALPIGRLILPGFDPNDASWITVWFVVDVKGRPQNLRVVRSTGNNSHEKALKMLRDWRLSPGTCDGKRIAMPTTMEIPSSR
jgi:hypothetical protein